MQNFARHQTAVLLRRVAYEVSHAAKKTDPDTIHDLRVAVRRLNNCLRTFSQFYPGHAWKKVKRRLHEVMQAAGAVRDCDIAAKLLLEGGVQPGSAAIQMLARERESRAKELTSLLRNWKSGARFRKAREKLGL